MGLFVYDVAPRAENEAAREAAIIAAGALSLMDHPALRPFVAGTARAFGTQFATISIVFRDWQYLIAAHGLPTGVTRRSGAFCAHAMLHPRWPFRVLDTWQDERFAENPNVIDAPAIRFYAGAALLDQADVALGTLCVFDPRPRPGFPAEEAAALVRGAAEVMALMAELVAGTRDGPSLASAA